MEIAEDCSEFPEAELNADGTVHTGPNPDGTVWGISNLHDHSESQHLSGGYMFSGMSYSPYGIMDALGTCEKEHGKFGTWDLVGMSTEGGSKPHACGAGLPNPNVISELIFNHHSKGYPDFESWPTGPDASHQKNYYQWLNRARLGGLRTITLFSVENYAGARMYNLFIPILRLISPELSPASTTILSGTESHEQTYERIISLINYVDAQEGGPGKGWLKLVTSPEQAREEVNNGNLCVILGIEIPDLFDCIDNSPTNPDCTRDYIRQKLDYYYDQGVRVIFPIHHMDTELGGAKIFTSTLELGQLLYNGNLIEWDPCEPLADYGSHTPFLQSQMLGIPDFFTEIIVQLLTGFDVELQDLDPNQTYCNGRGLTEAGVILVEEMIERGMMFDLDHCSKAMLEDIVEILDDYVYPFILSHNNYYEDLGEFVYSRGGMMSSSLHSSKQGSTLPCTFGTSGDFFGQAIEAMDLSETYTGLRAAPFTSDFFGTLAGCGPRFSDLYPCENIENPALWESSKVNYPFTSFDGQFEFDIQRTGNKAFDFNEEGLAHIGMLPDMIRDIMNQGYEMEDVAAFHNSTEALIRLWERSLDGSELYEGPNPEYITLASTRGVNTHSTHQIDEDLIREQIYNEVISNPLFADIPKSDIISALYGDNDEPSTSTGPEIANNISTSDIEVYPTLIRDQLTVDSELGSDIIITITNTAGSVVFNQYYQTIRNQKITGLSDLPPGPYYISITSASGDVNGSFQLVKPY